MTVSAPVAEVVRERGEIATRAVRWAVTHGDGGVTAGWVAEVAPPAARTVRREPVRAEGAVRGEPAPATGAVRSEPVRRA